MRFFAPALLMSLLAMPVAALDHDEASDGDLSDDAGAPTALAFTAGANNVTGTVFNSGTDDRDFLTFTVPAGASLIDMNLTAYTPDNLGFLAVNAGTTSFVPSAGTAGNFLAGIHPSSGDVGTDLLTLLECCSVTGNSLAAASLGPGDYSVVIQQTSAITTSYSIEFVLQASVPVAEDTWSTIKAIYR